MIAPTSLLLKITDYCSARCMHCPFSPDKKTNEVSINDISKILNQSNQPVTIISGGEPFEHKDFKEVILLVDSFNKSIFRIATGGHIPIKSYSTTLSNLGQFTGISLGTDIMLNSRNTNKELKNIWISNLEFLKEAHIPYSITFTLGSDLSQQSLSEILSLCKKMEISPSFFLIQNNEFSSMTLDQISIFTNNLSAIFPKVLIRHENIH